MKRLLGHRVSKIVPYCSPSKPPSAPCTRGHKTRLPSHLGEKLLNGCLVIRLGVVGHPEARLPRDVHLDLEVVDLLLVLGLRREDRVAVHELDHRDVLVTDRLELRLADLAALPTP